MSVRLSHHLHLLLDLLLEVLAVQDLLRRGLEGPAGEDGLLRVFSTGLQVPGICVFKLVRSQYM